MAGLILVGSLPWAFAVLLRWVSSRSDRLFTPGVAVRVFPVLGVASSVSVVAALSAIGSVAVTSPTRVVQILGVLSLSAVAWRASLALRHLVLVRTQTRETAGLAIHRRGSDDVVLIEDDAPDAFSVPAAGGAVVITTGLAHALPVAELRVVIAHERAHLRYRHHFWVHCAEIAAIVNPLISPAVATTRHAAERQADEFAARPDRGVAMQAVARVAVLCSRASRGNTELSLAAGGGDVVRRVRALAEPSPGRQRRKTIAACALLVAVLAALSIALFDVVQDVVLPESGEAPTAMFR